MATCIVYHITPTNDKYLKWISKRGHLYPCKKDSTEDLKFCCKLFIQNVKNENIAIFILIDNNTEDMEAQLAK